MLTNRINANLMRNCSGEISWQKLKDKEKSHLSSQNIYFFWRYNDKFIYSFINVPSAQHRLHKKHPRLRRNLLSYHGVEHICCRHLDSRYNSHPCRYQVCSKSMFPLFFRSNGKRLKEYYLKIWYRTEGLNSIHLRGKIEVTKKFPGWTK